MKTNTTLTWMDRIMAAVSFAEAGEAETAREMLDRGQKRPEKRITRRKDNRPQMRAE